MSTPAKKYYSMIISALVLLAVLIGYFVYSFLLTTPEDLEPVYVEINDGVPGVTPGGGLTPSGPPNVPPPTGPPPG